MKSYIPLIGYRKAWLNDGNFQDTRTSETRLRHWALVAYTNAAGVQCTAEFMVVTESMPDFCGGCLIYSPRVDLYASGNEWVDTFHQPGAWSSPDNPINLPRDWDSLRVGVDAIDLAKATGKETWESHEVLEYGRECIAATLVGYLMSHGKRGFVGADHSGGWMYELAEVMGAMSPFVATPVCYYSCDGEINNHPSPDWMRPIHNSCRQDGDAINGVDVRVDERWYNVNSGNNVMWITGNIDTDSCDNGEYTCQQCGEIFDRESYGYCPECDEDVDDDRKYDRYLPGEGVNETVSNPDYIRRARRHFWRNG